MTISQVIEILTELKKEHGDLHVRCLPAYVDDGPWGLSTDSFEVSTSENHLTICGTEP